MALDFEALFKSALDAGLKAARPGGKAAQDWIRRSAKANRATLEAIARGVADGEITPPTARMLLRENERALDSEAAALALILRAAAQGAVNAFGATLREGLATALGIAL